MRHLPKHSVAILLVLSWSHAAMAAEPSRGHVGFKQVIGPFFQSHCVKCHGPKKQKGKLTLHDIDPDMVAGPHVDKWQKIIEQLEFQEMPPEDESKRPSRMASKSVIAWVGGELKAAGKTVNLEARLLDPAFGNHVKHTELFSGKHKGPAYSPARLWRISPFVSDARYKNGTLKRYGLSPSQPFSLSDGQGIRDFASMHRLDGPTLELLLLNANEIVNRQLGPSPEQVVKMNADHDAFIKTLKDPGKINHHKRRYPGKQAVGKAVKEVRALAFGTASPSRDLLEQVIRLQCQIALTREPTRDEMAQYTKLLATSVKAGGRVEGTRAVLTAILMSPEAIYRMELGRGKRASDGRRMLSVQELAFALSYALRDVGPDKEMLADAGTGKLLDREVIAGHVRRMIDAEFTFHYRRTQAPRYWRFFSEFFGYNAAIHVFKDGSRQPGYTSPQAARLVDDTHALIRYIVKQDKDVLARLLTTDEVAVYTFQKPFRLTYMAYGVDRKTVLKIGKDKTKKGQVGNGRYIFRRPGERVGILTQPSWLMAYSQNFDNDVVTRGKWIYERLLAGVVPDVPITVDATVPADHDKSLRQRMAKTRKEYCWKCHRKMNSYGLAFESYDDVGRYRTKELLRDNKTNVPVVATGEIVASGEKGLDGPVKNAQELMQKLASSTRVRQSFVRHAFRYYMGRNETLDDSPTLMAADEAYAKSGGSMKELVASLLTSDSFLYRKN
jgi:hypothetical protein